MAEHPTTVEMIRWLRQNGLPATVTGLGAKFARAVLRVLLDHRNAHTGTAWPSMNTIAEQIGHGLATARRAMRCLKAIGMIRVVGKRRGGVLEYAFPGLDAAVRGAAPTPKRRPLDMAKIEAEVDRENLPAGTQGSKEHLMPKDGDDDESWAHNMALHAKRFWKIKPGILTIEEHIEAALVAGVGREDVGRALEQNKGQVVWAVLDPLVKAKAKPPGTPLQATREQLEQARRMSENARHR